MPEPDRATILSPLDSCLEVTPLLRAGAAELYAGVQPDSWRNSLFSASQRTFASAHFPSESAFREAAATVQAKGASLHLTLNAPLYDVSQYPDLIALAERAANWGVHGVILGDLGLLQRFCAARLPLEITLSTLAGAMNEATVRFYRQFGVRRIVFPRHLRVSEMARIATTFPDIRFEAFILIGKCPNAEAYCTFQHIAETKRWPCEVPYRLSGSGGGALPPVHPARVWHSAWSRLDRRHGCGLCAIPSLLAGKVQGLKIVGRGAPLAQKVANVELVAAFAHGGASSTSARSAYRKRFGCECDPRICYYPEFCR